MNNFAYKNESNKKNNNVNSNIFDCVIIGAGPAGYTAAINLAKTQLRVACIDNWKSDNSIVNQNSGGTCLNAGCIPSKILLDVSVKYSDLTKYEDLGIKTQNKEINMQKLQTYKQTKINKLANGIDFLFKKNNITKFYDTAKIIKKIKIEEANKDKIYDAIIKQELDSLDDKEKQQFNKEEVFIINLTNAKKEIIAKNIIIATGGAPIELSNCRFDKLSNIISSREALNLDYIPKSITILGGGYIGVELGSVFARVGSIVTIIDRGASILQTCDHEISNEMLILLQKQNINFLLNTNFQSTIFDKISKTHNISLINNKTLEAFNIEAEVLLFAIGRSPYTSDLYHEENINILKDKQGFIEVNKYYETSCNNIYAIGDVINKGPLLAHKAEEEAIFVTNYLINKIKNQTTAIFNHDTVEINKQNINNDITLFHEINYNNIPSVVYTAPEIASIGFTEDQVKAQNIQYKIAKLPFSINSKAVLSSLEDGFIKIISNEKDEIIGCHIIGLQAGILIHEVAAIMSYKGSCQDLYLICHAHPTLSEIIKETARLMDNCAINY